MKFDAKIYIEQMCNEIKSLIKMIKNQLLISTVSGNKQKSNRQTIAYFTDVRHV